MQLIGISCHIIAHNHAGTAWTFSLRGEVKAVHSPKVQPKAEETGIMGTVVEGGKEVGETEGGEKKKKRFLAPVLSRASSAGGNAELEDSRSRAEPRGSCV